MTTGQIITFYSYKGGTGRTMAVANVAWILASAGKRVLVVDWDLESPGLHRFFHPFLEQGMIGATPGVIDMITNYQWEVMKNTERPPDWHRGHAQVKPHTITVDFDFGDGSLELLTAGRQNRDYSSLVSGFDWDTFYERQGGGVFLDALRDDMRAGYDYVLIDSRTGLSDIAEICTVQLPDSLVACFTLSDQGIEGTAGVVRHIADRYRDRGIRILPVPMRVEMNENEKCDAGRSLARSRFESFPRGLGPQRLDSYWGNVEIPYVPYYAFEEILAAFGDVPNRPVSMLASFERLAEELTDGEVSRLAPMDEQVRLRYRDQYTRRLAGHHSDIQLWYVTEDQMWADWIAMLLDRHGYRVMLQAVDAENSEHQQRNHPQQSIVVLSSAFVRALRRLEVWRELTEAEAAGRTELVALRVSEPHFPPPFGQRVLTNLTRSQEEDAAGTLMRALGRDVGRDAIDLQDLGARFPGSEPDVWNVPARNAAFTGRAAVLDSLRRELTGGAQAVVLPQALYGLGGVGKTQVALEYAHRFRADYDVVWWISAENQERIHTAFEELARAMDIPIAENVAEVVAQVRETLRVGDQSRRWLLIFDNAGEPDEIRNYFPGGAFGHVLITSRNSAWSAVAAPLEIDVFTQEESLEHLSRRVPTLAAEYAIRVANGLGNLPLAVEQAAAWLAESGMPPKEFVAQLESEAEQVLRLGQPTDYPSPVAVTWNLSLRRLRETSPASVRLLELCAFFAPEPISMQLLYSDEMMQELLPYDDSLREKLVLGRVIREIGRYALAKVDLGHNTIQVHRLVQAVIRSGMDEPEQVRATHAVHRVLVGARPRQGDVDDPDNWHRYGLIWQHLEPSRATECTEEETRQLLTDRVRYLWKRGDFDAALELGDALADRWEAEFGVDDRQRLHLLFNVANVKRSQGKYGEARELDEWVHARQLESVGAIHPHTLMTAGGFAADLRGMGEYERGLQLDRGTYDQWKLAYGEEHPRTLAAANNLALGYRLVGDPANALVLDQDNLERRQRVLGLLHPYTLFSAAQVARDLRELGRFRESTDLLRATLQRYREALGDAFVDTLRAAKSLAVSLRRLGEQQEAWNMALETEDRYRRHYEGTPDALAARLELAASMSALGDKERAVEVAGGLVDHYLADLGESHPTTLIAKNNLATYVRGVDGAVAARELAERAWRGLADQLGASHPFTLASALNLANCLAESGDLDRAVAMERETTEQLTEKLGDIHPDTLAGRHNLCVSLRALGRKDEAAQLRSQTLTELVRTLGEVHPSAEALRGWRRVNRDLEPQPF
ncbi:MAG: tetratricopeptide repeat protein [Thermoactinospora sp.]|nr:tetratricopeptide repeat protein [Thermoactinospora sp.]